MVVDQSQQTGASLPVTADFFPEGRF